MSYTFETLSKFEPTALNKLAASQDSLSLTPEQCGDIRLLQKIHTLVDQARTDAPDIMKSYGEVRSEVAGQLGSAKQEREAILAEHSNQYDRSETLIRLGSWGGVATVVCALVSAAASEAIGFKPAIGFSVTSTALWIAAIAGKIIQNPVASYTNSGKGLSSYMTLDDGSLHCTELETPQERKLKIKLAFLDTAMSAVLNQNAAVAREQASKTNHTGPAETAPRQG